MPGTHHERWSRGIGQQRERGRRLVRQDPRPGGLVLVDHLEAMKQRVSPGGRLRVEDYQLQEAINWAISERALDKAEGDGRRYLADPDFAALAGFMTQLVEGGAYRHPNNTRVHSLVQTMASVHHQVWNFEHGGRHVYEVSPGLGLQLAHTEIRGVTTDDLRSPFPSIYVVVPPQAGLRIWNNQSQWHVLEGCYLFEEVREDGGRWWDCLFIGEPKGDLFYPGDEADDALLYMNLGLPTGKTMDQALEMKTQAILAYENLVSRDPHWQMNDWRLLFRFLSNVVLYATWPEADIEERWASKEAQQLWARLHRERSPKKRNKISQRLAGTDRSKRTVLGGSIIVRRVREELGADLGTPREGHALRVRLQVAGHWKRVVHGKGRAERRWQHVSPYWKGDESLPIPQRAHELR